MKKKLLLGLFCFGANLAMAQQAFVNNNLVVYRYNDGIATTAVSVFLDEYETNAATAGNATKVQTINVPTTTVGTNFRLRGIPKGGTNQIIEGYSSLSPDGKYLTIMGYDAPNGGGESNDMVIGLIDKDGNVNTSQKILKVANARPRNAITNDGTGFWIAPAAAGVKYIANGAPSDASVVIATTTTSVRNLYIFGGQLYGASGSNSFYTIGNGLPTTGTNTFTTKALPGLSNNSQMTFFDIDAAIPGPDLIYVVDDIDGLNEGSKTARLRKYKYNGSDWLAAGSIVVPTLKSITATINGNNVELYGATWGLPDGSIKSSLFKFTDNSAVTSNIDALTPLLLAEATAPSQFRSVTFTPGTTVETTLPIKLSSFTPKTQNQGILLEWTTASEKDNNYFEVLRSTDGRSFNKIGEVKGSGTINTAQKYSFLDENPVSATNYYKLRQFDFDGKSTESDVVSVHFSIGKNAFFITQLEDNRLKVNLQTNYKGQADFKITNISGQVLYKSKLMLENGNNSIYINKSFNGAGIFIATLSQKGNTSTLKFLVK